MYVCSLSGSGTTLNRTKINNGPGTSAKPKMCVTFLRRGGGSAEERPYDFSRGQNRFVTLPLATRIIMQKCTPAILTQISGDEFRPISQTKTYVSQV